MKKLKEENAPENDVKKAVSELKARKKVLEDKVNFSYSCHKYMVYLIYDQQSV